MPAFLMPALPEVFMAVAAMALLMIGVFRSTDSARLLTWLVIAAAFRLALVEKATRDPLQEVLLLISVCLFLVFFAWLRNHVHAWLRRAVFRQGSLAALASRLQDCPAFSGEEPYLAWAASAMAEAVRATKHAVVVHHEGEPALSWAEAVVPIRLAQGDSRLMLFGRRRGGQRYLGEDLEALAEAAAEVAGHVEALRREEMHRLVSQAELRALQSQINPHFLFNALNALYGTIPREAAGARRMVLNLAEIFRYFLHSDKTFVPLAREMQIVRAYLDVEQCRLGNRLEVQIQVDDDVLEVPIPVLSVQPLVENAIKHGIAGRAEPGYVRIQAGCRDEKLRIRVENSGGDSAEASPGPGVGLQNVRRRLEICYGPASGLELSLDPQHTAVELAIPLGKRVAAP